MKNIDNLKKELDLYKDLSCDEDARHFIEIWDEVIALRDISAIPMILDYFKDETEYSWIFESIRKDLEVFNARDYVLGILKFLKISNKDNKDWMKSFFYTILNSEECAYILMKNISMAPKEKLIEIFDLIESDSDQYVSIIDELKKGL